MNTELHPLSESPNFYDPAGVGGQVADWYNAAQSGIRPEALSDKWTVAGGDGEVRMTTGEGMEAIVVTMKPITLADGRSGWTMSRQSGTDENCSVLRWDIAGDEVTQETSTYVRGVRRLHRTQRVSPDSGESEIGPRPLYMTLQDLVERPSQPGQITQRVKRALAWLGIRQ